MKVKHGQAYNGAQTPEYDAWRGMIQRCTNPNKKAVERLRWAWYHSVQGMVKIL
jgi:hypothetical protein